MMSLPSPCVGSSRCGGCGLFIPIFFFFLASVSFSFVNSEQQQEQSCANWSKHWTPMPPDKRVFKSGIAIKALVTNKFMDPMDSDAAIMEFWILDVYKGADKLSSAMGILGGPGGVFNLRDQ